jgi:hypothetical protein
MSFTRRSFMFSIGSAIGLGFIPSARSASESNELKKKFDFLSQSGNSNCSNRFMRSIAKMPVGARLQGSCCMPMDFHRYSEQIQALKKYSAVLEIPNDPYDVPAPLAAKLMSYYDLSLSKNEQVAYDFVMANTDEKGPCCCKCWRWYVYGGLGKLLIREKGFDGPRLVDIWNLSSGCGGGAEHHH